MWGTKFSDDFFIGGSSGWKGAPSAFDRILVPRSLGSFVHVVDETNATDKTSSSGNENDLTAVCLAVCIKEGEQEDKKVNFFKLTILVYLRFIITSFVFFSVRHWGFISTSENWLHTTSDRLKKKEAISI